MAEEYKYLETLEQLKHLVERYREANYLIATTNGRFSPKHTGHEYMLRAAKLWAETKSKESRKKGSVLIVLLNSDKSVRELNGSSKFYSSQNERATDLFSLDFVDFITPFDDLTPLRYLKEIKPDIHIKARGESTIQKRIDREIEILRSWGGNHIILPLVEEFSTARIIERFKE